VTDATQFSDVLRDYGVDLSTPDARMAKALAVAAVPGATPEALAEWCSLVEGSVGIGDSSAPKIIAATILAGQERILAAIEDTDAYRRAVVARRAPAPAGEPVGPSVDPADKPRLARMAYCRVKADRRPEAQVARELGVSLADMPALIEQGRELSAPYFPAKPAAVTS
jgi:hypothetical protein